MSAENGSAADNQAAIIAALTAKLMELLTDAFGDHPELLGPIAEILPGLIDLAATESMLEVERVLAGLGARRDRAAWDLLIRRGTAEQRVRLMESTRQAAIAATVRKIQRERAQWEVLLAILKAGGAMLPLLLAL